MKKVITIVCDVDIPVIHLLNNKDYEVFQTKDDLFTIIQKVSEDDVAVEKQLKYSE